MSSKNDDIFNKLNKLDNENLLRNNKPNTNVNKSRNTKSSNSRSKNQELISDKIIRKSTNKQFMVVTIFSVLIFLSLAIYLLYFNFTQREDYISNPYNKRQANYGKDIIRGKILDKDGNVLAQTNIDDNGYEYREYPYGNLYSHVVGYSGYGNSGLEAKKNFDLLTSHENLISQIQNDFQNKKNHGDNVVTTLDTNLQSAASQALGSQKGAVVCMEPKTGKILAMYSNPGFDPNSIEANWDAYNADTENTPLLNRATQGLYPPGSTFKILTALEFKRQNKNYNQFQYDCNGYITYDNVNISCYNQNAHGHLDLSSAFANSCNCAFMTIGQSLDANKFSKTCENLLFNSKLPQVVAASKTRFPLTNSDTMLEKMFTSMGQGKTLVSPYHMALISSAIANNGVLMKPYLVSSISNVAGDNVESYSPSKYKTLITSDESAYLKNLMSGVVTNGTASGLSNYGYSIAGKTGTAEYSDVNKDKSHSWFVGFSNVEDPDLVVSVVLEGSDGYMSATNVAGSLFRAYHGN